MSGERTNPTNERNFLRESGQRRDRGRWSLIHLNLIDRRYLNLLVLTHRVITSRTRSCRGVVANRVLHLLFVEVLQHRLTRAERFRESV